MMYNPKIKRRETVLQKKVKNNNSDAQTTIGGKFMHLHVFFATHENRDTNPFHNNMKFDSAFFRCFRIADKVTKTM